MRRVRGGDWVVLTSSLCVERSNGTMDNVGENEMRRIWSSQHVRLHLAWQEHSAPESGLEVSALCSNVLPRQRIIKLDLFCVASILWFLYHILDKQVFLQHPVFPTAEQLTSAKYHLRSSPSPAFAKQKLLSTQGSQSRYIIPRIQSISQYTDMIHDSTTSQSEVSTPTAPDAIPAEAPIHPPRQTALQASQSCGLVL